MAITVAWPLVRMNAARITANALVGYVRRHASGAVAATTPARGQDSPVSECGWACEGPGRYVMPGSTIARPVSCTVSRPLAAATTAATVTTAARARSPTVDVPRRTGRWAADRTLADGRLARPASTGPRTLAAMCSLSPGGKGKPSPVWAKPRTSKG